MVTAFLVLGVLGVLRVLGVLGVLRVLGVLGVEYISHTIVKFSLLITIA